MGRWDWKLDALCTQMDPELFFVADDGINHNQTVEAKKVCSLCDVTAECLEMAMEAEERQGISTRRYGVFGGLGPAARKRLAYKRKNSA